MNRKQSASAFSFENVLEEPNRFFEYGTQELRKGSDERV
jgi:hypothetical protein